MTNLLKVNNKYLYVLIRCCTGDSYFVLSKGKLGQKLLNKIQEAFDNDLIDWIYIEKDLKRTFDLECISFDDYDGIKSID